MSFWPAFPWVPARWDAISETMAQGGSTRRCSWPPWSPTCSRPMTTPPESTAPSSPPPCPQVKDPCAYFRDFYANFYNTDENLGTRVSEKVVETSWHVASSTSAYASVAALVTWTTDFRCDVGKIADYNLPVMILH